MYVETEVSTLQKPKLQFRRTMNSQTYSLKYSFPAFQKDNPRRPEGSSGVCKGEADPGK